MKHDWIAIIIAGFAVFFYVFKEIIVPRIHKILLKKSAVDVFWDLLSCEQYKINYLSQDLREHKTVEFVAPSHTREVFIYILVIARRPFLQTHFELSFDGDMEKKPLIKFWFNPFVKRGKNAKYPDSDHPDKDQNHYVDFHENYHITDTTVRPNKTVIPYGFKIETRNTGIYRASIVVIADGIERRSPLPLTTYVEEPPSTHVRCVEHRECFIDPVIRQAEI